MWQIIVINFTNMTQLSFSMGTHSRNWFYKSKLTVNEQQDINKTKKKMNK